MKKNISRSVLVLGMILGLGYSVTHHFSSPKEVISVGGNSFRVERADTEEKRRLGLGERDSLCADCAMLFVFPEKETYSFWMKGMRFPLDIIWFDSATGRIVHLEKNVPPDSQKIFTPPARSDRVLEINGGLADKLSIQKGDQIQWPK